VQVLEPCQASLVYQPPNPWTMAILGLLCEIYAMPNLKMNLKFDIEVRCLNLDPWMIIELTIHSI
jgi:CCR4-NOT transcription complex subunit 1